MSVCLIRGGVMERLSGLLRKSASEMLEVSHDLPADEYFSMFRSYGSSDGSSRHQVIREGSGKYCVCVKLPVEKADIVLFGSGKVEAGVWKLSEVGIDVPSLAFPDEIRGSVSARKVFAKKLLKEIYASKLMLPYFRGDAPDLEDFDE